MDIQAVLSSEFQTAPAIIGKIVSLIDEGNTIPFIARYRKEMTGAMDDQKLREISERLDYLRGLDKRWEQIAASIAEQGKMTAELEKKLSAAATLSELEDIYRPYKQKRRTRAMIAKEKGVQPLADLIFAQRRGDDPLALAQAYVSEEKGVPDAETAVQLAQDILAEQISDDAAIRANLRALYRRTGVLRSRRRQGGRKRLRAVCGLPRAGSARGRTPHSGHEPRRARGMAESRAWNATTSRRMPDHPPCGDPRRAAPAATRCARRRRTRGARLISPSLEARNPQAN